MAWPVRHPLGVRDPRHSRSVTSWFQHRLQAAAPNVHSTVDDDHRTGVGDMLGDSDSSTQVIVEPGGGWSHLGPTSHKLVDAPGAGFGLLCVSDPVENGVPIRTCEHLKHRLRTGIGTQGSHKIDGHLYAGLPGVGGLPSTILFASRTSSSPD